MKEKVTKKYYMIKPQKGNKYQKTCAYVCVKSTDTNFSKGVNHKGKTTKIYNTPAAIDKGIEITKEDFLNEYNKAKQLKRKKGKLTIIVSKNYKELYEDNLALVNHILLDTVRGDFEWIEKVKKYNLNITLYTDKNDPELFKKSFGKFEVKLMDEEECNNNLKGLVSVSHKVEAKNIEELHVEHRDQNSICKSYNKKHLHLEEPIFNPQSHYNNEFGSLYKMSEQLGLNTYEFDILKRVVRCRKKGQFEEDLQKTKDLIDLYLIESKK